MAFMRASRGTGVGATRARSLCIELFLSPQKRLSRLLPHVSLDAQWMSGTFSFTISFFRFIAHMKRTASNEVVEEGAVKKANIDVNAMEQLVKEWAKGSEERVGRWIEALKRQDVDDLQALKELSADKDGWIKLLSDVRQSENLLATKLKSWKQSQPGSPVEGVPIDRDESPSRPQGPDIAMSIEGVKSFMRNLQRPRKEGGRSINLDLPVHTDEDRAVRLSGREMSVDFICNAWRNMKDATDRTQFKILVCSGLSGLGKTRMLEEWRFLFEKAGITGPKLGVIVLYFNGRGLRTMDRVLPAEASFSWRLLHRLFLDGINGESLNGPEFSDFFRYKLPGNAAGMTLKLAFEVIRAVAREEKIVKVGETLSLFLGVDEYQKIPPEPVDQEGRIPLKRILEEMLSCRSLQGLKLFPMFAGTDWSKMSIARSSTEDTLRVPLHLLPPRDAEAAIGSRTDLEQYLASTVFRRLLFSLGGVPRFLVEFGNKVGQLGDSPERDEIVAAAAAVWSERVKRAWVMDARSYVKLVAYSVAGVGVLPDDVPGIGTHPGGELAQELDFTFRWRHLADMGVCTLDELGNDPEDSTMRVGVPYCVFGLTRHVPDNELSDVEKALLQNLNWLKEHVDRVTYELDPWQLWEKFGACFHAMRINSLIIVRGDNDPIPFSMVCSGASVNGCEYDILLRPMRVMETDAKFGVNLEASVPEKENFSHRVNWLTEGWVLLNGSGGTGVDLFFALCLADGSGHVVCSDQRKREAGSFGPKRADSLWKKAHQIPSCLSASSKVIVGLFSMFPSYNRSTDSLPHDCFVVSFREHQNYHGCLVLHPASSPCVDVNRDNQSMLMLLDGVNAEIAKAIIARRKSSPFDIGGFKSFLKSKEVTLSDVDEERVIVFGKLK